MPINFLFRRKDRGASLTGYGLIVGLIAVVALTATNNVGVQIVRLFDGVGNKLDGAVSGGGAAAAGNQAPSAAILDNNSLMENNSLLDLVGNLSATDPDAGDNISFSISGVDAAAFQIGGALGDELQAAQVFDFEVPADTGGDNIYDITITATDDGIPSLNSTADFSIMITNDASDPALCPSFTSGNEGCTPGDGTIFAGLSIANAGFGLSSEPLFVMPTDQTTSINSIAFEVTLTGLITGCTNESSTACFLGENNTAALVATAVSNPAAELCACLGETTADGDAGNNPAVCAGNAAVDVDAGGHNDWYLPSIAELDIIYSRLFAGDIGAVDNDTDNPISVQATFSGTRGRASSANSGPLAGSFDVSSNPAIVNMNGGYWTSTQENTTAAQAWLLEFGDGGGNRTNNKDELLNVRCVRR